MSDILGAALSGLANAASRVANAASSIVNASSTPSNPSSASPDLTSNLVAIDTAKTDYAVNAAVVNTAPLVEATPVAAFMRGLV